MTPTLKARPTTYNGVQMRSRLEATVAAVFDHMGIEWEYEPRAFASVEGQYLPDFYLPDVRRVDPEVKWAGNPGVYVEVRPTPEKAQATLERDTRIMAASHDKPLVSLGFERQAPTFGFVRDSDKTRFAAVVRFSSPREPALLTGIAALVHYAHRMDRIQ